MSNLVRIKRRVGGDAGAPTSLQNAELAFNETGDVLYYGKGTGGAGGTATSVEPIGGSGAFLALYSNQTVDGLKTFLQTINGSISGNAGTATKLATARNIAISGDVDGTASFDGSGNIDIAVTLDTVNPNVGTFGSSTQIPVIAVNGKGLVTGVTTANVATQLSFSGNTGADTLNLLTGTLAVTGSTGITTAVTNDTITITGTDATTSSKGVASFSSSNFEVATGAVSLKAGGVSNSNLANSSITIGTTTIALGGSATTLSGLAEPTQAQDVATKNYVDLQVQGLNPKQAVRAATTANLAALSGALTIDGITLVAGDRVLVKDQTTKADNGIYVVAAGPWARGSDANTWVELISAYVFVQQGTVNADNGFLCTVDAGGTLGSTNVVFVQFNGAGQVIAGNGLTKNGNQLDVGAGTGIAVASDAVGLTGQALALHNLASNGFFVRTEADTIAARSITTSGNGLAVANGNGVSGNPTLSLDATLDAFSQITFAANTYVYATGADAFTTGTITAFGRSLLDDADAAAGRTTLGLGGMATQASNNVSITGGSISNITLDGVTIDGGTF